MQIQNDKIIEVDSFQLAATLRAHGFALRGLKRLAPRKAAFLFQDSTELRTIIEQYYGGKVRLDPRQIYLAQDELKQLLYGGYLTKPDK